MSTGLRETARLLRLQAIRLTGCEQHPGDALAAAQLDRLAGEFEQRAAAGTPRPEIAAEANPAYLVARADLAQAIATLGRLLPQGMSVTLYRPENDPRVAVETAYADGETTRHYADQAAH